MKIPVHGHWEVVMVTIPLGKERRQVVYCSLLEVLGKEKVRILPKDPIFSCRSPKNLSVDQRFDIYKVEYLYQCLSEWFVFSSHFQLSILVITLADISKLFIKHVILQCIFWQVSSVTLNISLTFPFTHWAYTVHAQEHFIGRNFT